MVPIYISYVCLGLAIVVVIAYAINSDRLYLKYRNMSEVSDTKLLKYENDILQLSRELKDIAALNKTITDSWCHTVQVNQQLNEKITELANKLNGDS